MKKILLILGLAGGITVSVFLLVPEDTQLPAPTSQMTIGEDVFDQYAVDYNCTQKGVVQTIDYANASNKIFYACPLGAEEPDTKLFPDNLTGAVFICSNLDNLFIPEGNTIIDNDGTCGSRKVYKVQADGENWILDSKKEPLEPINKELFIKEGKNIDPKDIQTKEIVK